MKKILLLAFLILSVKGTFSQNRSFVCADYTQNKVFKVDNGKIVWEHDAHIVNDVHLLPSGNLLFTTGDGVLEVNNNKDTIFYYKSESSIFSCQRLKNGDTFIAECSAGRLIEVSPHGDIVKVINLNKEGGNIRKARKLDNGNYLVCFYGGKMVCEYDFSGNIVWSVDVPDGAHTALRLKNGNTLVSGADRTEDPHLYEFNKDGNIVWQYSNADVDGDKYWFFTGFEVLKNGNIVINNWGGHGHLGETSLAVEITRDKKIVWQCDDHKQFKAFSTLIPTKKERAVKALR